MARAMAHTASIALQSCFNFREVAGLHTRSGRQIKRGLLFRSDSLHKLSEAEASLFSLTAAPKTIVDLRSTDEMNRFGAGPLADVVRYRHMPIAVAPGAASVALNQTGSLLDVYVQMADASGPVVADVIRLIGSPDVLPAVVFCAAGKDRTGITVALLLGTLNVNDDDIVGDYAATRPIDPAALGDGYAERFASLPAGFHEAPPEAMRGFLAAVRRKHGSLRAYAVHHGATGGELRSLERALLERD